VNEEPIIQEKEDKNDDEDYDDSEHGSPAHAFRKTAFTFQFFIGGRDSVPFAEWRSE
jgi:hypothetical protein